MTTRPTPEALWRAGADLTAAELSALLDEATGWTVERVRHEGEPAYYLVDPCLLYTSPSPRDRQKSRMPSSA